ncbi:MAG TPA: YqgE/AlgH family protein [Burkholderiales bacterium]|nr:YqgE/AlgH family protein [Burkholderiales bacterium]
MKRWLLLLAAFLTGPLFAQSNAVVLVAKPGLTDPNFKETVVLVTRSPDGASVGVILNRPTRQRLAELAPGFAGAEGFPERLYAGGPVMQQVVVALFFSETAPKDAAFHVLPDIYLTLHPRNIEALLAEPRERARLYAGFSGWAPNQLEAEIEAGGWFALRATESLLFRKETSNMWRELIERAGGSRAALNARDILVP